MKRLTYALSLVWCTFVVFPLFAGEAKKNYTITGDGPQPKGWHVTTNRGTATFGYEPSSRNPGGHILTIASSEGTDSEWTGELLTVKPFSTYRVTGWIKTENVDTSLGGFGAVINLHNHGHIRSKPIAGTTDWTRIEFEFDTAKIEFVRLNCLFGGWNQSTGKAYFDDIKLELLNTRECKPSLTIDTSVRGEPISPLIYGQFIEHVGRCIHEGIWAEILADRKFLYRINHDWSPWRSVGDPKAQSLDRENPFVGQQTPVITLSPDERRGITQSNLGVRKGRQYVGYVILAGDADAPIQITFAEDADNKTTILTVPKLTQAYTRYEFPTFTANEDSVNATLSITAQGSGTLKVGTVSIMPVDNIDGMRRDVIELLRTLNSPIYRWPGGNFVSGYDWKDGIGPRDRRPPRRNPAWPGSEDNDFGLDEFMHFCKLINTEPLIVINSGGGDPEMARQELEYANGSIDTPMGRWRCQNGNEKPYDVTWWGVGNEMWGPWQIGYMSKDDYFKKHNLLAEIMLKVDPKIKLIGTGDLDRDWTGPMLKNCADHMDLISEHFYCFQSEDIGMLGFVDQSPYHIRRKVEAIRKYHKTFPELKGKQIKIAFDEWNHQYGPTPYGVLGYPAYYRNAMGIAAGLHEMMRNSDIIAMANYSSTVNVLGVVKTNKTDASMDCTGWTMTMYRNEFGSIPVEVSKTTEPLDIMAAITEDGKTLTIGVVNPTQTRFEVPLAIQGATPTGSVFFSRLHHDDPMVHNVPGQKPEVEIISKSGGGTAKSFVVTPMSVTIFHYGLK